MSVYLDACVLVPLFVNEASSETVRAFTNSVTEEIVVSDFAVSEFGAAISRHVRSRKTSESDANGVLALFDEWEKSEADRIMVSSADISRSSVFVRRFALKLLTPDAIHLAICERHGLTLVTLDQRLRDAAGQIGVKAMVP